MIRLDSLDLSIDKKEHIKRLAEDLTNIHLDFEYASDFKNAKELRDFVDALTEIVWMPKMWRGRFILVTDEMNNNAIEYGSKPEDINRITFKVIKRQENIKMIVEVEDTWRWKAPKTAEQMYALKDEKIKIWFDTKNIWIRWRGLFLITQRTVDKLYFKDSTRWWLIVWVEKDIILKEDNIKEVA